MFSYKYVCSIDFRSIYFRTIHLALLELPKGRLYVAFITGVNFQRNLSDEKKNTFNAIPKRLPRLAEKNKALRGVGQQQNQNQNEIVFLKNEMK